MRLVTRVFALLLLAACGGSSNAVVPPVPPPVTVVTVTPDAAILVPNQTAQLAAIPKEADGRPLTGRAISWSSATSSVATVDGNGLVLAVAPGTTQVSATSEGKTGSAAITVRDGGLIGVAGGTVMAAAGNVVVTLPAAAVPVSVAITVSPAVSPPASSRLISGTAYDFGPDGTQFATPVTLTLKYDPALLAVGAVPDLFRVHKLVGGAWTPLPGSTVNVVAHTVTGQTTSFSTYAVLQEVAPVVPVAVVEISPPLGALLVGATLAFTATLKDAQGNPLTGRVIDWTSTSSSVATVSTAGLVTAVAPGQVTIRATSEGIVGSVTVTVTPPLQGPPVLGTLSVGTAHSCALTPDGTAYCWGRNDDGQLGDGSQIDRAVPTAVQTGVRFSRIGAGYRHTCGLAVDQNIYCWGAGLGNDSFTPTVIGRPGPFISLFVGSSADQPTCAVGEDRRIYCWPGNIIVGATGFAPAPLTGATGFTSVATSKVRICGLMTDGQVYCAPANNFGRFLTLTPLGGTRRYSQLVGGSMHICGVASGGDPDAFCWGYNDRGQLGNGSTGNVDVPIPTLVAGGHQYRSLTAGTSYTCGLTLTGQTYCWGNNDYGQLGDNTDLDRHTPNQVGSANFVAVDAGDKATCALATDGQARCWGSNTFGVLGNGVFDYAASPTQVAGGLSIRMIRPGEWQSCLVTTSDVPYCWGGPGDLEATPVRTAGSLLLRTISVGRVSICGVSPQGQGYCWGDNTFGQLGSGSTGASVLSGSPVQVTGNLQFTAIEVGNSTACGLTTAKDLYCWGQMATSVQPTPALLYSSAKFTAVSLGGSTRDICALEEAVNPRILCWNRQEGGALTIHVSPTGKWQAMARSQNALCALTDAGVAYCLGDSQFGVLGDGVIRSERTTVLAPVSGGLTFRAIATGENAVCGVTVSGETYCWGYNWIGQVGDGTRGNTRWSPARTLGAPTFAAVFGGTGFKEKMCGVTVTGSAFCWGNNLDGGLGIGDVGLRLIPTLVQTALRFRVTTP